MVADQPDRWVAGELFFAVSDLLNLCYANGPVVRKFEKAVVVGGGWWVETTTVWSLGLPVESIQPLDVARPAASESLPLLLWQSNPSLLDSKPASSHAFIGG